MQLVPSITVNGIPNYHIAMESGTRNAPEIRTDPVGPMQLGMPIASAGTTGGALGPGPVRLINNQKPRLLHRGFQYVTQVLRGSLTAPSGERNKEPASNHQARPTRSDHRTGYGKRTR